MLQSGDTPLHCAAKYGHYEVCSLLLQYGANADISNKVNFCFGLVVLLLLQVLAIKFVTFAIEFVHLAIEFIPLAIEFVT